MLHFLFQIFLYSFFFHPTLQNQYIVTWPNPPYSDCPQNGSFIGLDIEYSQLLMQKLNFSIDWQFLCLNLSDPNILPEANEILFFIGGIFDMDFGLFPLEKTQKMKLSIPIQTSGLSILLYQEQENWVFFRQFSWETIFLMILFPLIIGFLQFLFEERKFALEDYLWSSYSALFLMNNLKLCRSSSRIMLFGLWIVGFIIWTFCFAGIFSAFYLKNPLFHIKSAFDLKDKLILTQKTYYETIRLYGGKPMNYTKEAFSLSYYKALLANFSNGALVLEDPLAAYIESLDKNFWRVDALFEPMNFYLFFPENSDISLNNQINEAIMSLSEEKVTYEALEPAIFNRKYKKSLIPMNYIDEMLILLGICLAICIFCHLIARFWLKKLKFYEYLVNKKLVNISEELKKKQSIFVKKTRYVFSFESLKEIIKNEVEKIASEITLRLEIMTDKINRFYDMILIAKKENSHIEVDFDEKINKKFKKPFTFPSITKGFKKSSAISVEKEKARKKSLIK